MALLPEKTAVLGPQEPSQDVAAPAAGVPCTRWQLAQEVLNEFSVFGEAVCPSGVAYGSILEASRVQVKLGRSSVNTIEVLEGLRVGDEVILSDMSAYDAHNRVRLN